ncbi:MAG: hypothetical protein IJK02_08520 [Clostridia bacterium]|nr:hypothetical protein [Clostridia bacterium]MBR0537956.1 hypothetical protein [Clostridia bacterium]
MRCCLKSVRADSCLNRLKITEADGTYSYSFVFNADGTEKTFGVTVE